MSQSKILTKDTVIKTNLFTIIAVITVIITAFVSYTVAINRLSLTERNLVELDTRVDKLESDQPATRELLVEIRTDVQNLKKALESRQ